MIHITIIIFAALALFSKSYEANKHKQSMESSVRIQSAVRGFLARKKLQTQAAAATTIQKQWRRRAASKKTKSAIQIQTVVRGFLGRKNAKARKEAVAATKIQAAFRAARARAETRRQKTTTLYPRTQAKTQLALQTIHLILRAFFQVARVLWGIVQLGYRFSQFACATAGGYYQDWNVGEKLCMFLPVCFVSLRASVAFLWPLFHLYWLGTCRKLCIGAMATTVSISLKSIGYREDAHNNPAMQDLRFLKTNGKTTFDLCDGEQTPFEASAGLQRALRVVVAQLARLASSQQRILLKEVMKNWTVRRYRLRTRSLVVGEAEESTPVEHDSDHGVQTLPGPRNTLLPRCGGPTCSKGASVCCDLKTVQGADKKDSNPKKRQTTYICLHTLRPFRRRRVDSL